MENKQAYQSIIKARTRMILSHGFFGCLAMQLKLVEITEEMAEQTGHKTMAVDGVHMYYYPKFVLGIGENELMGVIAHETFHCAYKHMTRRQHREPRRFNYAGDFVINGDLIKAGLTLPGKPSYQQDAILKQAAASGNLDQVLKQSFYLLDPQYDGMSTEEVYEKLPEPIVITLNLMGLGEGKGNGQGNDPTGCGAVIDASAQGDIAEAEAVGRAWEGNVRMAINVARANNAGKTPGYLERLVKEINTPKVSWRALTRNFIDNSTSKDFSFSKPNRRSQGGMILPGYIPDRLNHLVMFVDNSGSINGDLLKAFVSEVAGALDEGTCDKLSVVYADDGVRHVDEYLPGDLVEAKMLGGGGTDFRPSFNWLRDNAADASAAIYLTDMMTSDFGDDPSIPVLWGVWGSAADYEQYAYKAPFGQPVRVDVT